MLKLQAFIMTDSPKNIHGVLSNLAKLKKSLEKDGSEFTVEFAPDDKYPKKPTVRLAIKGASYHSSENMRDFIKNLSMYITILQIKRGYDKDGNEDVLNSPVPSYSTDDRTEQIKCYVRIPDIAVDIIDRLPNENTRLVNGSLGAAGPTTYRNAGDIKTYILDSFKLATAKPKESSGFALDCKFNQPSNHPIIARGIVSPDNFFPYRITISDPQKKSLVKDNNSFFSDFGRSSKVTEMIRSRTQTSRELLIGEQEWTKDSYHFVGVVSNDSFTIFTDSLKELERFLKSPSFNDVNFTVSGHTKTISEIMEIAEIEKVVPKQNEKKGLDKNSWSESVRDLSWKRDIRGKQ